MIELFNYRSVPDFSFLKKSSVVLSGFVLASGVLNLAWQLSGSSFLNIPISRGPLSLYAAMVFVVLGGSLLLHSSPFGSVRQRILQVIVFLIFLLGLGCSLALLTGSQFLAGSQPLPGGQPHTYLALYAALNVTMVSLALLLSLGGNTRRRAIANFLALAALFNALFVMLSYLYTSEALPSHAHFRSMAMYAALFFSPASLSILFNNAGAGLMYTFSSFRLSGYLWGVLTIIAVVFMPVAGLTRHYLEHHHIIAPEGGISLAIAVNLILFLGILYLYTKNITAKEALREHTERELAKANHIYNTILESSMSGYWDWDIVNDKLFLSPAFREMLGYSKEEIITSRDFAEKIIDPEDKSMVELAYKKHIESRGNIPFQVEARYRHINGSTVWVMSRGKVIEWSEEHMPVRMVGSHVNITLLKVADEKIKESENLFSNMFQNSPVTLLISEATSGILIDVNDNFSELFGYSKEEALGKSFFELGLLPTQEVSNEILEEVDNSGRVRNKEILYRVKSGQMKYTSYSAFRFKLFGEDCMLSAIIDIDSLKRTKEKLDESQKLFSKLFYESPIMLTLFDAQSGSIIDVNKNVELFLGVSKDKLLAKYHSGIFMIEIVGESLRREIKQKGNIRGYEFPIVNHANEERIVSCDVDFIEIEGKRLMLVAGIDISEKKKAENQIKNMNATLEQKVVERTREIADYKFALDESSLITVTDAEGIIRHVNDNFCRLSQYGREELIGQTHRIIKSGHHDGEFFAELWQTISRGRPWQGEIKNRAKDGSNYWLSTSIIPFLNASNNPYQFLAIQIDVTARKNAEEALMRSETNLRSMLDNADTAYILFDAELRVRSFNNLANAFAKRKLQYELAAGQPLIDRFPKEKKDFIAGLMEQALRGESPTYEICYPNEDGAEDWFYTRCSGINTGTGPAQGLIMQISNITEKKYQEKQWEKMTLDLVRQNQNLESFSYIVSHNLRSPVSTIMGLSLLMRQLEPTDKDYRIVQEGMETSVNKLDQIIKDLNHILELKQQAKVKKEKVNLSQLTGEVTRNLRATTLQQRAEIHTNFGVVEIYSVRDYLFNIFHNLISNSLKYHKPTVPPVIRLGSRMENDKIVLFFEDNGSGIDLKRYSNQIFGLYKRFNPDIQGKGMGLFITKTQVEALGGAIRVKSEPNKGSKFEIELPNETAAPSAKIPIPARSI